MTMITLPKSATAKSAADERAHARGALHLACELSLCNPGPVQVFYSRHANVTRIRVGDTTNMYGWGTLIASFENGK